MNITGLDEQQMKQADEFAQALQEVIRRIKAICFFTGLFLGLTFGYVLGRIG